MKLRFRCDEDWGAMEGEAGRRRCDRCATEVHDLSALTPAEAEGLLAADDGRLCVRYRVDAAGEVLHRPPAGRPTDRLLALAAVFALPVLGLGMLGSEAARRASRAEATGLVGSPALDMDPGAAMERAIEDALVAATVGRLEGLDSVSEVPRSERGDDGSTEVRDLGPPTILLAEPEPHGAMLGRPAFRPTRDPSVP